MPCMPRSMRTFNARRVSGKIMNLFSLVVGPNVSQEATRTRIVYTAFSIQTLPHCAEGLLGYVLLNPIQSPVDR